MTQKYDVVLFGATSFVGKIAAHYLAQRQDNSFTWAIAARSQQKLDALLNDLPESTRPNSIIADASDADSLNAMCEQAKVIISTVGPYALYGEPLIKACIASGADYVDLTGEPQWIKRMLDRHSEAATKAGVRLVNSCGFDSIPSDLGVYFLQQQAQEKYGQTCQRVAMRVHRIKGGASGGTIASMLNLLDEVKKEPSLRKVIGSPYALCPAGHELKAYQPTVKSAKFDQETNRWMAPFIMEAINSRIVHRSNALLDAKYGKRFVYGEAMLTGKGLGGAWRATTMALGLGGFMFAANIRVLRNILEQKWLPKPGEGPSPMEQQNGLFDIRFYGYTESGKRLVAKVTGDRDPGYGSTAKMLSEAAICLAQNEVVRKKPGGFYTPASVFDDALFTPLTTHAGLTFNVIG
ncbi:saccharopine dehydrogenase [Alteromonas sediminis]|uniref:Saccharopine dehydrogenase n=1 Tax=Alteromonas sediminis TaxID=2259342 RepID=A0A3N5XX54_9ALTE|nr:saccharopine dehydrogenase NADP-binding domain-containing protein [Alteromonas sediminis]RPJ65070.1 saccharopine dehydrogenase [Alteromonas sediminis]